MDKRRTIFPGTARDPSWQVSDSPPPKRSAEASFESGTNVLKKQTTSSSLFKPHPEPASVLTKIKEHDGIVAKPPEVKNRILPPTYGRLASSLPILPESPWSKYRPILTEEQGGDAIIAHSIEASFELVVVRCLSKTLSQKHGGSLRNSSHANIVPLYHAFQHNEILYFVYSPMSVPLAALQCVAEGDFEAFEVAAICKEVLNGLVYVHSTLEISYGFVGGENILLDSRANVKLANIGESMLDRAHNIQKDISDLGTLASKLSRIFHKDLDEVDGGTIGRDLDIHSFIMSTQTTGAAELQEHAFLKLSPGPACLVPRVAIAERQWFRNWTIEENETGA